MDEEKIQSLLSNVDSLIKHTYHFRLDVSKLKGSSRQGISINFTDLQERRYDFVRELKNTVCNWVYGKEKYQNLFQHELKKRGFDIQNVSSHIDSLAKDKFRKGIPQGQFGELLLFNFIQYLFKAPALLRKMPLTTSRGHERFGADAIHYKRDNKNNIIYIGESKAYKSKYKFNVALEDSLNSIIGTYNNLQEELLLYTYDDFIDPILQNIAEKLKEGELENTKYELVCLISYNETNKYFGKCEEEIKEAIKKIVLDRLESTDDSLTNSIDDVILERIHYIIFPFWEFDKLLEDFDS
ncbi:DUF1837 domain-containing protein [Providencia manganoxydans]|uniref:HamA C-terminal domain-containing protein n=1 Tax=Providencia manganoxydans TaxID=2923283 RepID=UPI0034E57A40